MPICKFFEEGRCRYGDKCWNDHPGDNLRGAVLRGDYYVSSDSRSLWRKDLPPALPSFSFKQAQSIQNRPPDYLEGQPLLRRPNQYYEDASDNYSQGTSPLNSSGRNPAYGWNANQHQNQQVPQTWFQGRPAVEYNQAANNRNNTPPSFSFNAALNKQLSKEPPSFSFKQTHNQLHVNEPVSFSFRSAQNQLTNIGGSNNNRNAFVPQRQTSLDRSALGNSTSGPGSKSPEQSVPSILASANILQVLNLYSSLSQLSKYDREQFEAARFLFGKIPTVPPPQELC